MVSLLARRSVFHAARRDVHCARANMKRVWNFGGAHAIAAQCIGLELRRNKVEGNLLH